MKQLVHGEGSCLCGAVTIEASGVSADIGACHCGMCRKWSGGPFLGLDCGTDLAIDGEESVSCFSSSEWAERGFCSACGTHLFYKLKQLGQYIVPVGVFDNVKELRFDHQIFVDEKPDYYCFANETKNMTGEEAFAEFAEQE